MQSLMQWAQTLFHTTPTVKLARALLELCQAEVSQVPALATDKAKQEFRGQVLHFLIYEDSVG